MHVSINSGGLLGFHACEHWVQLLPRTSSLPFSVKKIWCTIGLEKKAEFGDVQTILHYTALHMGWYESEINKYIN